MFTIGMSQWQGGTFHIEYCKWEMKEDSYGGGISYVLELTVFATDGH